MRVLEFGCGTGSTALLLAPHVGMYEAVDLSQNMISIANKNLIDTPIINLIFRQDSIESYPVSENTVDAIVCNNLLHLLKDPKAAINKIFHLLVPGGLFFSTTSCMLDGFSFTRHFTPAAKYLGLMPDFNYFSKVRLEKWVRDSGFVFTYKIVNRKGGLKLFFVAKKPKSI